MSCILIAFTVYLFVSSPTSLSVDLVPADTAAAADLVYIPGDPSFAAKQPGKQNPLEHAYITYSFSLLLALEFATAFV